MNTISDLLSGRFGLARTYWLWGVLSGIPWGIVLSLVTPGSTPAILAVLALVVYYVIVHVGIWRAASQYQGAKVWAILAKIAVLITPVCLVLGTILAVALPAYQDQKKRSTITQNPLPKSSPQKFENSEILPYEHRAWSGNISDQHDNVQAIEKKARSIPALKDRQAWSAVIAWQAYYMDAGNKEANVALYQGVDTVLVGLKEKQQICRPGKIIVIGPQYANELLPVGTKIAEYECTPFP